MTGVVLSQALLQVLCLTRVDLIRIRERLQRVNVMIVIHWTLYSRRLACQPQLGAMAVRMFPPAFALCASAVVSLWRTSRRAAFALRLAPSEGWYARWGLNPQPSAPEADALSN